MLKGSHILETKEKQKKSITGTTVWEKSPFDYTPLSQSSSASKPLDKRQPCPRAPPRRTGANGKHHNGFDDFKSHLYVSVSQDFMSWGSGQLGSTCPTTPVAQATLTNAWFCLSSFVLAKVRSCGERFCFIFTSSPSWTDGPYEGVLQSP